MKLNVNIGKMSASDSRSKQTVFETIKNTLERSEESKKSEILESVEKILDKIPTEIIDVENVSLSLEYEPEEYVKVYEMAKGFCDSLGLGEKIDKILKFAIETKTDFLKRCKETKSDIPDWRTRNETKNESEDGGNSKLKSGILENPIKDSINEYACVDDRIR